MTVFGGSPLCPLGTKEFLVTIEGEGGGLHTLQDAFGWGSAQRLNRSARNIWFMYFR